MDFPRPGDTRRARRMQRLRACVRWWSRLRCLSAGSIACARHASIGPPASPPHDFIPSAHEKKTTSQKSGKKKRSSRADTEPATPLFCRCVLIISVESGCLEVVRPDSPRGDERGRAAGMAGDAQEGSKDPVRAHDLSCKWVASGAAASAIEAPQTKTNVKFGV